MLPRLHLPLHLPLPAALMLAGLALGGVAVAWSHGAGAPASTVITQRDLLFEDRADGAVLAVDAGDHHLVEVFEGQNGFLRGLLRGFARTRRIDGFGKERPFHLAHWADGRITLDDPATGQHAELLAFGATNAAVFAKLLEATP